MTDGTCIEERPELSLCLLDTLEQPQPRRIAGIGAVSVVANLFLLLGLSTLASIEGTPVAPPPPPVETAKSTPLFFPKELTQTAPNKAKVAREVHLEDLMPRPATPAQRRIFTPPPTVARAAPQPAAAPVVEPPSIRVGQTPTPTYGTPNVAAPPVAPPQIQAQEKPKLAFETPGSQSAPSGPVSGNVRIQPPRTSVDDAIRRSARSGGGGIVVGDSTEEGGIGQRLGQAPSAGKQASQVELLSDPQGVDFRPYLIRVLTAVRRNWFSVIPESVRFGRQGRVVIQFAIAKSGSVPKLVIAMPSGTEALDRAAVAGISASNPFPPLPVEFKGDQIRVQLVFSYNVPTR